MWLHVRFAFSIVHTLFFVFCFFCLLIVPLLVCRDGDVPTVFTTGTTSNKTQGNPLLYPEWSPVWSQILATLLCHIASGVVCLPLSPMIHMVQSDPRPLQSKHFDLEIIAHASVWWCSYTQGSLLETVNLNSQNGLQITLSGLALSKTQESVGSWTEKRNPGSGTPGSRKPQ